ncbi:hypothetical protein L1D14_10815 [Vibrio tubiashii]|uniref:hypothetical protein n=1 Tax=Vibrio tubiashii TaxID=29498 RepID=UPI001EFED390|nr:hypothetical protein [Vibrio tubiashii]MCG9576730.1 hypothetical protein [Vibrio tubiashii]
MAPFKSTVLKLDQATALVLQTIAEQAPKAIKAAINTTLTQYKVEQLEAIELNKIAELSTQSTATVRKLFLRLKEVEGVSIQSANQEYDAISGNVKLYSFPDLGTISLPQNTPKKTSISGAQSSVRVASKLQEENIYIPENYRGNSEEQGTIIPQTLTDTSLIGCGNAVIHEKTYTDSEGYVNKVVSTNGIINDFDISILDILLQKTSSYLQNLPEEKYWETTPSTKIPIFIEDILSEKSMNDLTENRMAISESIRRIWSSQYETRDQYFKKKGFTNANNFQFFASFDALTASSDEEHVSSSGELLRPYVCVSVCWNPLIWNYVNENTHLLIQNATINKLPTLLYAFYRRLRLFLLSKKLKPIIESTKTLDDLVKEFWTPETPEVHRSLCNKFILDIKKLHKKKDRNLSVTYRPVDGEARAKSATVSLGGFTLTIIIPNPDRPSNAANRKAAVHIDYHERAVIEHAGARFDMAIANNTPTAANPLYGKRRQLTALLKRSEKFSSIEFQAVNSEYYFGYSYPYRDDERREYLITAYATDSELEKMFTETANAIDCDAEQFKYYMLEKIAKLKPIPHITHEDINALVVQGLEKAAVLNYLCDNIRSTGRLKREGFENLKTQIASRTYDM